jgi:hypothetical protein
MDTFINIIYAVIGLVSFGCFIYILIRLDEHRRRTHPKYHGGVEHLYCDWFNY